MDLNHPAEDGGRFRSAGAGSAKDAGKGRIKSEIGKRIVTAPAGMAPQLVQ